MRLLHFSNTFPAILVTLFEIVILARLLHPKNTESPILDILFGSFMLAKLLQSPNAYIPILVTPSSITTDSILSLFACHGEPSQFQFAIAPVPLMVSTPSSSSIQVRLSPLFPSAPQVPLATILLLYNTIPLSTQSTMT